MVTGHGVFHVLSTPCNGFWVVERGLDQVVERCSLSTPCNGFSSTVKNIAPQSSQTFQLHVMDSPGAPELPALSLPSFNSM